MTFFRLVALLVLSIAILPAQMTPEQRAFDFQVLASLYAKRYGPANWKIESIGVNIFELKPWMDQVRTAKSDLEYFEIASRFVASLRDGHTGFSTPSRFLADLGVYVDVFDNKVLIDSIVRSRYPAAQYPFQIGDELVSIDGRDVEDIIRELAAQQSYSNPRATRRMAADAVTFRPQSEYPMAVNLPDQSDVVIRRANGDLETYKLTWQKTGTPVRDVAPGPIPSFFSKSSRETVLDPLQLLREMQNWSVPAERYYTRMRRIESDTDGGMETEKSYVIGWGNRVPYYAPPPGFQVRLGLGAADPFFSGSYTAGGKRIGLLRFPSFGLPIPAQQYLTLLDNEINFFRANTDGLIVDVTRNTGGGCIGLDIAARLIPGEFWFFGEHMRPTQALINTFDQYLTAARNARAEQWVIDTYEARLNELKAAQKENRAMTGPIPACTSAVVPIQLNPASFMNRSLPNAYDKPMIFLADEFSVSFGDIFPAMMQDNKRGPIVGMRTGGWGGSISGFPAGFFSEANATNTNSLVVRRYPVSVPGMPTAPFIENIGVVPDVEIDAMTRDNLLQNYRPFVNAFTQAMLDEINKPRP